MNVKSQEGRVFFTSDFATYESSNTCNKALERSSREEKIMRVDRGIYTILRKGRFLDHILPSIEVITHGIARRDRVRIIPTGIFSEKLLGLSMQVPMKVVYLIDGTARRLMIDKTPLILKKQVLKI
jgi:hypothetical protein